jgi:hypothetical protein
MAPKRAGEQESENLWFGVLMVGFLCQLSQAMVLGIWSSISLDVTFEGIFFLVGGGGTGV